MYISGNVHNVYKNLGLLEILSKTYANLMCDISHGFDN